MTFTPSPEQIQNLKRFDTGRDQINQAGAGCGKTHEITRYMEHMEQTRPLAKWIYIALQKTLADEVTSSVTCGNKAFSGTIHSLAWQMLRHTHPGYMAMVSARMPRKGKQGQKLPAWKKPELIGLHEGVLYQRNGKVGIRRSRVSYGKPVAPHDRNDVWLTPYMLYQAATDAVRRFCMSDRDEIELDHARAAVNAKRAWAVPYKMRPAIAAILLDTARAIWADALDVNGKLPYSHDWYLKFWSLTKPDILRDGGLAPGSVLFFDEAQDAKPCVSAVIEHQRSLPAPRIQIVAVGDSAQAIFGFTGAVDALRRFSSWDDVDRGTLSISWRFHQGIADEANTLLDLLHAPIRLRGNPNMPVPSAHDTLRMFDYGSGLYDILTEHKDVDAVICRTNREVIAAVTPLVEAGFTVHCDVDTTLLRDLAADVVALSEGRTPATQDMKVFATFADLTRYVDAAEPDDDLAATLSQILALSAAEVLDAMNRVTGDAATADVTVSTIHKAKGKQWDTVVVMMDPDKMCELFLGTDAATATSRTDALMLTYVALTRARNRLYVPDELRRGYDRAQLIEAREEMSEALDRAEVFAAA